MDSIDFFKWIALFLTFATISSFISKWYSIKNRALKLAEEKFLLSFDHRASKDNANAFLNKYIGDCMEEYVLYNIVPDTGLDYITKEREDKIREELTKIVVNRMSDTVKKQILLCYSEDYFSELIANKIFYTVSVYVADFNDQDHKIHIKDTKNKARQRLNTMDGVPPENDW